MNTPCFKSIRQLLLVVILGLSLLPAGCTNQSLTPDPRLIQPQTPKPIIFDTDMAHEDMFAALFLLSHPNVDVRAITVSGTGEAHCRPGVSNALGLVRLSGHEEIPVACGSETPLVGKHVFPAEWRQAVDHAYGVEIPAGGTPSNLGASDLIIELLQKSNETISIVAVGPLTNIAEALQKVPEISTKIKEIYIMGGAVEARGNVGNSGVGIQNPDAEWNIYIDPVAANIVFKSGVPIVLVSLDATNDVPVTRDFYESLEKNKNTPTAKLVYELLTANLDFVDSGGFQFWDSLTSATFTDQNMVTLQELNLSVVEEEGPQSGRVKQDPTGATIKVAMSADRKKFERLFLTVLNWID